MTSESPSRGDRLTGLAIAGVAGLFGVVVLAMAGLSLALNLGEGRFPFQLLFGFAAGFAFLFMALAFGRSALKKPEGKDGK